jgi:hypothetical protein
MASLTLRVQTATGQTTKNAPLTNAEIDNNFISLNTDILSRVLRAGDTLTGKLSFVASTTTAASTNIPSGVAPTAPVTGDIWSTTAGIFHRLNSTTTKQVAYTDSAIGFANVTAPGQTAVSADQSNDTLTIIPGANISITTDPANDSITISSSSAAGSSDIVRNETTATAGQTTFAVTNGFSAQDVVEVYVNGILLSPSDYTLSSPNIVLETAASAGDLVTTVVIKNITITTSSLTLTNDTSNVSSYVTFSNGATGTNDIKTSANLRYNASNGTLSATNFSSTSDRKLKKNIVKITGDEAISVITALNGYEFDFIDSDVHASGVIAQEVEQQIKHATDISAEGNMFVSYNQIIPYLIESIKKLQEEIILLKSK